MGKATLYWHDAVIYQIYVRSFADSNGDGIGDLDGIRSKLDYVAALGVDGIWLNPCYASPQRDHGYDVADYFRIEPAYGSNDDIDALISEAHARDLRLLMDIVPNHCSSDHEWFKAALVAAPGSPERERFLFRDGLGENGELPPNNWRSTFGGPAWTRVVEPDGTPGQWYLHLFDAGQPDFNWRNSEVVEMFEDVLRFWFDRGVDGFRIDVAHGLFKHVDLPDGPATGRNSHAEHQPEVHEIYRRWRKVAQGYGEQREVIFVGEVWAPSVASLAEYVRPDELHQAFYFDLLERPWDAAEFRDSLHQAFEQIVGQGLSVAWTLNNHDVHRSVTRYGIVEPEPKSPDAPQSNSGRTRPRGRVDLDLGIRRARAAAQLLLGLPGAIYLYQGEELGLPEVQDLPDEAREDPVWFHSNHTDHGRDGSRVPLPWTASGPTFGFSPEGATGTPWLPQAEWFGDFAVSAETEAPGSVLSFYREALGVRRSLFAVDDQVRWLETGRDDVLAFARGATTVVTVFGLEPYAFPAEWGTPVLSSAADGTPGAPESTTWLRA